MIAEDFKRMSAIETPALTRELLTASPSSERLGCALPASASANAPPPGCGPASLIPQLRSPRSAAGSRGHARFCRGCAVPAAIQSFLNQHCESADAGRSGVSGGGTREECDSRHALAIGIFLSCSPDSSRRLSSLQASGQQRQIRPRPPAVRLPQLTSTA